MIDAELLHLVLVLNCFIKVQVMWASDPVPKWEGGGAGRTNGLSSKLVRPELPLSRHGRGKKLGSTIVNPRDENNASKNTDGNEEEGLKSVGIEGPFKGREIVAYDDIL